MAERRILFFSKAPMNYAVFRPVAEKLAADPRVQLDVFAHDGRRSLRAEHAELGVPAGSFVGRLRARYSRYDLYLSADIQLVGKRARRKAHLFHGISFKGKAYTRHIKGYDRAFLIGPYQRRQYITRGILPEDDPRFAEVGMPRTDGLVNGHWDRREVLERLGAPLDRPVVLYAPTWRKEASLNIAGEEIIETIGAMGDVTLLVKLHDLCLDPAINKRDWGAWMRERQQAGATWFPIIERDISPYLAIADLLVSDASSTANEFLLLDRPIVFYDTPELFEKYRDSIDLETWGQKTGLVAKTPGELPELIRAQLADPAAQSAIRREAARDYFYNPGSATGAAVRETYSLLELDQP